MNKPTALLAALLLLSCLAPSAQAQQRIEGGWAVQKIEDSEPPEGVSLVMSFEKDGKAKLTYTVAGESQSWSFTYAVKEGRITLKPAKPFGEADEVEYDYRFDAGQLLLLTPKDEDPDKPETETEPEEDKEDTRKPVWVLTPAG